LETKRKRMSVEAKRQSLRKTKKTKIGDEWLDTDTIFEPSQQNAAHSSKKQKVKGKWTPKHGFVSWNGEDELRLIESVLHCPDLKKVAAEVNFSQPFPPQEIMDNWTSLLYDPEASRIACEKIEEQRKVLSLQNFDILWTSEEDAILRSLNAEKSNEELSGGKSLKLFENVLEENKIVFHHSRTPKSLRTRSLYLLKFDTQKSQEDAKFPVDDFVQLELDRNMMKERRLINQLETELIGERKTDFNKKTLAFLKGEKSRFEILAKEVLLGRKTEKEKQGTGGREIGVDIDLSEEKNAHKISKKQAVIQLNEHLEFFIINLSKTPIYVDGEHTPYKTKRLIQDAALIDIAENPYLFDINTALIAKLRKNMSDLMN